MIHASRLSDTLNPVFVKDLVQMWRRYWLLAIPGWWVLYGLFAAMLLDQHGESILPVIRIATVIAALVSAPATALALESRLGHITLDASFVRSVGYRRFLSGKLITTALIALGIYLPWLVLPAVLQTMGTIDSYPLASIPSDVLCMLAGAIAVTTQSIVHAGASWRMGIVFLSLPVLAAAVALPILFQVDFDNQPIAAGKRAAMLGGLLLLCGLMIFIARRIRWYPAYHRRPLYAWLGLPDRFFRPPHQEGAE